MGFFPYVGGKGFLAKKIVGLIPEHRVYVEPFCGSAKVFFAKPPSKIEVLNDYDRRIANLFFVVAFKFDEFYERVRWLVYSEALHNEFQQRFVKGGSEIKELGDVENAIYTYYTLVSSMSGLRDKSFLWGHNRNYATYFTNKIRNLQWIHNRLSAAVIRCQDFEKIFEQYGGQEDVFFYLDPPYYGCESYYDGFARGDHQRLLDRLKQLKGKWLLSGYHNELYDTELKDYAMLEIPAVKRSCIITGRVKVKPRATEVLWANYPLTLALWACDVNPVS